jgi:hypothetical protein
VLLLVGLVAHGAAGGEYRLAGVVAVGEDFIGFLELPGGTQVLVRQGSVINGDGRVVILDGGRLRIAFPGRTIDLTLEGTGAPAAAISRREDAGSGVPTASVETPSQGSEEATVGLVESLEMLEVDAVEVARALGKTSSQGKARPADPAAEAAQRFASVVDLPRNSRVLSVNGTPVTSADAAIRMAEKQLAAGGSVGLKLATSGDGAVTRVYLMPATQP